MIRFGLQRILWNKPKPETNIPEFTPKPGKPPLFAVKPWTTSEEQAAKILNKQQPETPVTADAPKPTPPTHHRSNYKIWMIIASLLLLIIAGILWQ
ncbi:hypothetical protein TI03_03545 [Achromatium sp. WMS1]|nr:hypothetical protein TI03_03545 [Achromatium sp. WMS1]